MKWQAQVFAAGVAILSSSVLMADTDESRSYCEASGGCMVVISNVNLGSIDNSSVCDGYGDYTYLFTVMEPTDHEWLTVELGDGADGTFCCAWVDWNQDYDFDDPDETLDMNPFMGPGPYTAIVHVPSDAAPGTRRLRIRTNYNYPGGPCGHLATGEVEDYTIYVGAPPASGACCFGMDCTGEMSQDDCATAGGVYQGDGTVCDPNPCVGACCFADGTCELFTGDDCSIYGGSFSGPNTNCDLNECPQPPPACVPYALFGQLPHEPNDPWLGVGSDEAIDFTLYENFWGVTEPICEVRWWGFNRAQPGGPYDPWEECHREPDVYNIRFYEDDNDQPAAVPTCEYLNLTPDKRAAGIDYSGRRLYIYNLVLDVCCTLESGWVSIQGADSGTECWFLWVSSADGDQSCLGWDGIGQEWYSAEYDLNVCLAPEYVPAYGACCDDSSGDCVDGIERLDCTGRFTSDALCADIDPPCGQALGACCYPDYTCELVVAEDCVDGEWLGADTTCDMCPAPPDYCDASGGCDEYIGNVSVGDIDKSSNCTEYGDYTSLSTDMQIGEEYTITVVNGNPSETDVCGIWVDWNQDRDFDDVGEQMDVRGPDVGPYTSRIAPPPDAASGDTRLRIRIQYGGEPLPCGVRPYGEVEDYTITIPSAGIPGDLDGDGDVDLSDLSALLANYGMTEGATYEQGDIDGDGDVDLSDLSALLANYGAGE